MSCLRCKKNNIVLLASLLSILFLLIAHSAQARIYTFIDEAGTIHFSNVPTDLRYRPASISKLNERRNKALIRTNSPEENDILSQYDRLIRSAALRFEVDPLLVKAIIKTESAFNPHAISKVGAQGLMQLMPETANDMKVTNPFDPEDNINGGTKYFRKLLGMFKGNIELALAAYNAGPTRVSQLGKIPKFTETTKYVKKVLGAYDGYKATSSPLKKWVKFSY